MGFEDILRRRLGPYYPLRSSHTPENPDPAALFYRRALGLEVRFRPEDSWAEAEVLAPKRTKTRIPLPDLHLLGRCSDWKTPAECGAKPSHLWSLVQRGWLYYAKERPELRLTGDPLELEGSFRRRRGVWPLPALETSVEIAPFPFMPRMGTLRGAFVAGARFDARESGTVVFSLTIVGSEELGRVVRDLVPLLGSSVTPTELRAEIRGEQGQSAIKLVELLGALGFLEKVSSTPNRAPEPAVTWLGHAGFLFSAAEKNVLVDPLFFAASEPETPFLSHPRFDPRTLPTVDAVLITHGDNDHLNPASLFQLPRSTVLVLPKAKGHPYEVDGRAVLKTLGFREIVELEPWDELSVGRMKITACPFRGEDWGLELPQATFLIEGDGARVFASADSLSMNDVYEEIARRGPVDLAFMGVGGNAEAGATPPEFGYGNFYESFIPEIRHQEWMQHCAGPKHAFESLRVLRPKFAFGYAAGGASYIEMKLSDRGDHAQLADLLGASDLETKPVALPIGEAIPISDLPRLPR